MMCFRLWWVRLAPENWVRRKKTFFDFNGLDLLGCRGFNRTSLGGRGILKPVSGEPRFNQQIRAQMVRLIDADGTQLGVRPLDEALRLSQDRGIDLVEVAPQANPPVCKILDFSKYRYEREKQRKEAKKHQKGGHVKEVRFRPKIGLHDFDTKVRHMQQFLENRDKVRLSVVFHGREMEHKDIGRLLLDRAKEQLQPVGLPESEPTLLGNRLIMIFAPKK